MFGLLKVLDSTWTVTGMQQASGVRLEDFQQLVLSLVTSVLDMVRVGCGKVASYNRMMSSPGKGSAPDALCMV